MDSELAQLQYAQRPTAHDCPRVFYSTALTRLRPPSVCVCRQRNAQIDRQQQSLMREAGAVVREQEDRLAALPVGVDTTRASRELRRSAAAVAATPGAAPEATRPQRWLSATEEEAVVSAGAEEAAEEEAMALEAAAVEDALVARMAAASSSDETPAPSRDSGRAAAVPTGGEEAMGGEASLRYTKARLAVTVEELERLRALLAQKSAAVVEAEASLKELQQKNSTLSRTERSLQAALEKEKSTGSESVRRAETLERELSLLKRQGDDAAKREKTSGADARSKDVRLNRALEELERTRAQLKQLKDERDGAGVGARNEASRLAAENTRLRKRQSELVLAFKKQAKLIDVLKRQKLHVEAATLLSFTEDEFSKTLELGEQLAMT